MPFIAKLKQTGKRIDIADYKNAKAELHPSDIVCQFEDCGAELFIRAGLSTRTHFAHKPKAPCKTAYAGHPESEAHHAGKRCIADYLLHQFKTEGLIGVTVELEIAVPEAGRIADVMVTYPMGWREAHEFQIASITPQELEARTSSYFNQGIDAIWWIGVGSAADNDANRQWLQSYQGESVLLASYQVSTDEEE